MVYAEIMTVLVMAFWTGALIYFHLDEIREFFGLKPE